MEEMYCTVDGLDLSVWRFADGPSADRARSGYGAIRRCDFASDVTIVAGGPWLVITRSNSSPDAWGTPAERRAIGRLHQRIAAAARADDVPIAPAC